MRIVRKKLSKEVVTLLQEVSRELGVEDYGFTCDVFCLMLARGTGIPAPERIEAIVNAVADADKTVSKINLSIMVKKRVQVLKSLIGTSYFKSLSTSPHSTIDATRRLLLNMRKMYLKVREAQCMTCALMSQCQFGQQYSNSARNITYVVDPKWDTKVHQNCPVLPQLTFANQVAAGARNLQQIAAQNQNQSNSPTQGASQQIMSAEEELENFGVDEVENEEAALSVDDANEVDDPDKSPADLDYQGIAGAGKGSYYDSTHTGQGVWKINEKLIDDVSKIDLMLFELGRKLELALEAKKKGKYAPVQQLSKDKDSRNIEAVSDLPKIEASQHALPTKLFDAKLQKKTLTKTQHMEPESKKHLLYILLDASGSMGDPLCATNNLGIQSKSQLASILCSAFLRRVSADKGIAFFRTFASAPGPLKQARTPDEFQAMIDWIIMCSYGGGTSLTRALNTAVEDMTKAKDEIAKSDLLIITDAEDCLDEKWLRDRLGKIELNVLDVSGSGGHFYGNAAVTFKKVAKRYYKGNDGAVSIDKLVELM